MKDGASTAYPGMQPRVGQALGRVAEAAIGELVVALRRDHRADVSDHLTLIAPRRPKSLSLMACLAPRQGPILSRRATAGGGPP